MADVNQERTLQHGRAVFESLRQQHVRVRVPFVTPCKQRIYVIDDCTLREAEILELKATNKLTMNDIREFLSLTGNDK